jgi:hypothetical protein
LAVPVGTWILFTALLSILISPIAGWASIYLNNTNWLLAHAFLVIVKASAAFPGQAMNVGGLPWPSAAKIVVLASGRSETFYLRQGSSYALVNPGSPSKYRRITEPFLRSEGVNCLSFLNWTKSDQDHAGSGLEVAKHFKVAGTSDHGLTQTATGHVPIEQETINLSDETAWKKIKPTPPLSPVLDCQLGSFEVLLLNVNHQQIEKLPSRTVDVVVVPSQRQCSAPELIRKFHPQAILYLQGKPTGSQTSAKPALPIWFSADKGAVTMALSNQDLELSGYLGDRLILRRRIR